MATNTQEIKNRIINVLKEKGPLLPAYISQEIKIDTLLTSAFLSELVSEKLIESSHMRVGNSAIYYLKENKHQLEKYADYLKSKEKEAFNLIKEKKFLKDKEQEPAIRVALRQIRDFASPFNSEENIMWKYFKANEEEYKNFQKQNEQKNTKKEGEEKELNVLKKEENKQDKKEESKEEPEKDFREEDKEKKPTKKTPKKSTKKKTLKKKTTSTKKSEKFFNKTKDFLNRKNIEILDICGASKDNLILKIKENQKEILLIAYNKKRILEQDIIKAHKKAQEVKLKYKILSLGEISKKLENFIDAIRNLEDAEKIE